MAYDTYRDKNGNIVNVNYLSSKQQMAMANKGWSVRISKFEETSQELYDRLAATNREVKVYYTTTSIRGYYNILAMTK